MSRGSSGGIVTRLRAGQPKNRSSVLGRDKECFSQCVQTGCGFQSIHSVGAGGCFPRG